MGWGSLPVRDPPGRARPAGSAPSAGSGRRFRCDRGADGARRRPLPPARPQSRSRSGAGVGSSGRSSPAREGSGPGLGSSSRLSPPESFAEAAVVSLLKRRAREFNQIAGKRESCSLLSGAGQPRPPAPARGSRTAPQQHRSGEGEIEVYGATSKNKPREELVPIRGPRLRRDATARGC